MTDETAAPIPAGVIETEQGTITLQQLADATRQAAKEVFEDHTGRPVDLEDTLDVVVDSLMLVSILAKVEDRLEAELPGDMLLALGDLKDIRTAGDLVRTVVRYTAAATGAES